MAHLKIINLDGKTMENWFNELVMIEFLKSEFFAPIELETFHSNFVASLHHTPDKILQVFDAGRCGIARALYLMLREERIHCHVILGAEDIDVAKQLAKTIRSKISSYRAVSSGFSEVLQKTRKSIKKNLHFHEVRESRTDDVEREKEMRFVENINRVIMDLHQRHRIVVIWPNMGDVMAFLKRSEGTYKKLKETVSKVHDPTTGEPGIAGKTAILYDFMTSRHLEKNSGFGPFYGNKFIGDDADVQQWLSNSTNVDNIVCTNIENEMDGWNLVWAIVVLIPSADASVDIMITHNNIVSIGSKDFETCMVGDVAHWRFGMQLEAQDFGAAPRVMLKLKHKADFTGEVPVHIRGKLWIEPHVSMSSSDFYKALAIPAVFGSSRESDTLSTVTGRGLDMLVGIFADEYYVCLIDTINCLTSTHRPYYVWWLCDTSLWAPYLTAQQEIVQGGPRKITSVITSTHTRHAKMISQAVINSCTQFPNSMESDVGQTVLLSAIGCHANYNTRFIELFQQLQNVHESEIVAELKPSDFAAVVKECKKVIISATNIHGEPRKRGTISALQKFSVIVINNHWISSFHSAVSAVAMLAAIKEFVNTNPVVVAFMVDPCVQDGSHEDFLRLKWMTDEFRRAVAGWKLLARSTPLDPQRAFVVKPVDIDESNDPLFFGIYGLNTPNRMNVDLASCPLNIAPTDSETMLVQIHSENTRPKPVFDFNLEDDGSIIEIPSPVAFSGNECIQATPLVLFDHGKASDEIYSPPTPAEVLYAKQLVSVRFGKMIERTENHEEQMQLAVESTQAWQAIDDLVANNPVKPPLVPLVIDVSPENVKRLSRDARDLEKTIQMSSLTDDAKKLSSDIILLAILHPLLKSVHDGLAGTISAMSSHKHTSSSRAIVLGQDYKDGFSNLKTVTRRVKQLLIEAEKAEELANHYNIEQALRIKYLPIISALFNVIRAELKKIEHIETLGDGGLDEYLVTMKAFSEDFLRQLRGFCRKNRESMASAYRRMEAVVLLLNSNVIDALESMEVFYGPVGYAESNVMTSQKMMDLYVTHEYDRLLQRSTDSIKLYATVSSIYLHQLSAEYESLARRKMNDSTISNNIDVLKNSSDMAKALAALKMQAFVDDTAKKVVQSALLRSSVILETVNDATPPGKYGRVVRKIDWNKIESSPVALDVRHDQVERFIRSYESFRPGMVFASKNTTMRYLVCTDQDVPIPITELAVPCGSDAFKTQNETGVVAKSVDAFTAKHWRRELPEGVFKYVARLIADSPQISSKDPITGKNVAEIDLMIPEGFDNLADWLLSPLVTDSKNRSVVQIAMDHLEQQRPLICSKKTEIIGIDGKPVDTEYVDTIVHLWGDFLDAVRETYGSEKAKEISTSSVQGYNPKYMRTITEVLKHDEDVLFATNKLVSTSVLYAAASVRMPNDSIIMDVRYEMFKNFPFWWKDQRIYRCVPALPNVVDGIVVKMFEDKQKPSDGISSFDDEIVEKLGRMFINTFKTAVHDSLPSSFDVSEFLKRYCYDINRGSHDNAMFTNIDFCVFALIRKLLDPEIATVLNNQSATCIIGSDWSDHEDMNQVLVDCMRTASTELFSYKKRIEHGSGNTEADGIELDTLDVMFNTIPNISIASIMSMIENTLKYHSPKRQSLMNRKVSLMVRSMFNGRTDVTQDYETMNAQAYTAAFVLALCNIITWSLNHGIRLSYYFVRDDSEKAMLTQTFTMKLTQDLYDHFIRTVNAYDFAELYSMWKDETSHSLWVSTSTFFGHRLIEEPATTAAQEIQMIIDQSKDETYERTPMSLIELACIDPEKLRHYHQNHGDSHQIRPFFEMYFKGLFLSPEQYQSLVTYRNSMDVESFVGDAEYEGDTYRASVGIGLEPEEADESDESIDDSEEEQELKGESVFTEKEVSIMNTTISVEVPPTAPTRPVNILVPRRKRQISPPSYEAVPGKRLQTPDFIRAPDFVEITPVVIAERRSRTAKDVASMSREFVVPPVTSSGVTDVPAMHSRLSTGETNTDVLSSITRALENDLRNIDRLKMATSVSEESRLLPQELRHVEDALLDQLLQRTPSSMTMIVSKTEVVLNSK
ncbi:MAG: hypothetical protein JSS82_03980 [Bacteroidetes bacterium]|nr:hypothetical protein [Bacteroidota bacterium]